MTARELNTLVEIDREIDREGAVLTDEKRRLYRALLTKYISEISLAVLRNGGSVSSAEPAEVAVA